MPDANIMTERNGCEPTHSRDGGALVDEKKNGSSTTDLMPTSPSSMDETMYAVGTAPEEFYTRTLAPWRAAARRFIMQRLQLESEWIARMQERFRSPWLDTFFVYTSSLGTQTFFMMALPALFFFGFPEIGRGAFLSAYFPLSSAGLSEAYRLSLIWWSTALPKLTLGISLIFVWRLIATADGIFGSAKAALTNWGSGMIAFLGRTGESIRSLSSSSAQTDDDGSNSSNAIGAFPPDSPIVTPEFRLGKQVRELQLSAKQTSASSLSQMHQLLVKVVDLMSVVTKQNEYLSEELEISRSNILLLQRAVAGNQDLVDALRIRLLMDDARQYLRFALVILDPDNACGFGIAREKIGSWWPAFRDKMLKQTRQRPEEAPASLRSLLQHKFEEGLKTFVNDMEERVHTYSDDVEREADEYRKRFAHIDDIANPYKLEELVRNISTSDARAFEADLMRSGACRDHLMSIVAACKTASELLRNEAMFRILEDVPFGDGRWFSDLGNAKAHPIHERDLVYDTIANGSSFMPIGTRQAFRDLHSAVNNLRPMSVRQEMPRTLQGPGALLLFPPSVEAAISAAVAQEMAAAALSHPSQ